MPSPSGFVQTSFNNCSGSNVQKTLFFRTFLLENILFFRTKGLKYIFFRTNFSHYINVLPNFDAAWKANTVGCSLLYKQVTSSNHFY